MDASFAATPGETGSRIREMIADFNNADVARLEADIFKQRKRLAMAERTLQAQSLGGQEPWGPGLAFCLALPPHRSDATPSICDWELDVEARHPWEWEVVTHGSWTPM